MRTTVLYCPALILFLSGCWIGIPKSAPPAAVGRVGDTGVLIHDLELVNEFEALEAWQPGTNLGDNQHIVCRLPAGTRMEVLGFVYRRTPNPDLLYYYVVRSKAPAQKFYLPVWKPEDVVFERPEKKAGIISQRLKR
jgi:hypothetical protein